MKREAAIPPAMRPSAPATTRRTPKTFMVAAANGPSSPKNTSRTASADEICAFVQPNSCSRGPISTPAEPIAPAVASIVRKVTAATSHP